MPWTRRQVRFLESSGSPLTSAQKSKMNAELHADPSLGSKQKGSPAMKHDIREMRIEIHRGKNSAITGHTVHHHMMPKATRKSGAFMEETHHAFPFDAKGESSTHGNMLDHLSEHLKLSAPSESEHEGQEQEEATDPE
jgi:hypothetical protein